MPDASFGALDLEALQALPERHASLLTGLPLPLELLEAPAHLAGARREARPLAGQGADQRLELAEVPRGDRREPGQHLAVCSRGDPAVLGEHDLLSLRGDLHRQLAGAALEHGAPLFQGRRPNLEVPPQHEQRPGAVLEGAPLTGGFLAPQRRLALCLLPAARRLALGLLATGEHLVGRGELDARVT